MASADNPIHAVELAEAPDSPKSEVIEPTEEEWELYNKYDTQKLLKQYKDYIPKKQFRHNGPITCCALSPSGKELVTGSADNTAIVWDKKTGKKKKTKKTEKTPNLSFGCELPEKLTRRALILDANSGCGGRPGPRESIWAYSSAMFDDVFFFSFFWCCILMACFEYGPFFRRFPFFAFGVPMGFFHKFVFSVFLMKNTL